VKVSVLLMFRIVLLGLAFFSSIGESFGRLNHDHSFSAFRTDDDHDKQQGVLGLDVRGRLKIFLRGPKSQEPSLETPLFSSRAEKQPRIYATADYHFQKERWYGLKRVGSIIRWQPGIRHKYSPRTVDFIAEREFGSEVHPLLDSTGFCFGWDDPNELSLLNKPSLEVRLGKADGLTLGWFVPIRRRLHLYWTSHFAWKESANIMHIPSRPTKDENVDWWVPEFRLDPLGLLTSENKYARFYKDRYLMRLGLRFSKRVSSLATRDDGREFQVRLDLSLVDKDGGHPSISTARVEALVDSANFLQSLSSTRLVLVHEDAFGMPFKSSAL
jgi:hypothetical protein